MLAKLLFKPLGVFFGVFVAGKVTRQGIRRAMGAAQRDRGADRDDRERDLATGAGRGGAEGRRSRRSSAAAFARVAAKGFRHMTGFWPGEEHPPPAKRIESKR